MFHFIDMIQSVPCIHRFASVAIQPTVPSDSFLPLAFDSHPAKVDAHFLNGNNIHIMIQNCLHQKFMLCINGVLRQPTQLYRNSAEYVWSFWFHQVAKIICFVFYIVCPFCICARNRGGVTLDSVIWRRPQFARPLATLHVAGSLFPLE